MERLKVQFSAVPLFVVCCTMAVSATTLHTLPSTKSASSNNEKHVTVSPNNKKHVTVSPNNEKHVTVSPNNEKHVTVSPNNEKHVTVSPNNEKHVTVSPNNEKHVTVSRNNEKHVTISLTNENDVSVSPNDEKHVFVSHDNEKHVSVSPNDEKHVFVSHDNEKHVSVSTINEKHVSVSPTKKENVSVSPTKKENVSVSPTNKENVSVSPTKKENLSIPSPNTDFSHTKPQSSGTSSQYVQTATHHMTPSVPTPSAPPDTCTRCRRVEDTRTDRDGTIAVTQFTQRCTDQWVWNIHLPSRDDGLVFQFHNLSLNERSLLEITEFWFINVPRMIWGYKKRYKRMLRPLLSTANRFRVVLKTPCNPNMDSFTVLNVTYSAHPMDKMPQEAEQQRADYFYVCSGDILIPAALRCNMVKECKGNEDEEGCDYTHHGCGDWVPYRHLCLKLVFFSKSYFHPNNPHPAFPNAAERTCSTRYGADLALLKDTEDVTFVGRVMRQAGFQSAAIGLRKVRPVSSSLHHLYRYLWQWGHKGSLIAYDRQYVQAHGHFQHCAHIITTSTANIFISPINCSLPGQPPEGYVCSMPRPSHPQVLADTSRSVALPRARGHITRFPSKECADGSLVQTFHVCLTDSAHGSGTGSSHDWAMYMCRYGPSVHYSLVCDGSADCADGSDEADCAPPRHPPLLDAMYKCNNFQLVPKLHRCDGKHDCFDQSDERDCTSCHNKVLCPGIGCLPVYYGYILDICPNIFLPFPFRDRCESGPCVVLMDGYGMAFLQPANHSNTEGTFPCRDGHLYIPSFLLNNGEQDCTSGEDENIAPHNLTCPAFYRCQYSSTCVHPDHVCDGVHHCPNKDDERYCDLLCPDRCLCEGYAFSCPHFSNVSQFLLARFLDLSAAQHVSLMHIHVLELLRFLNLSRCGLYMIHIRPMPQLQILDVSFNEVNNVSSFELEGLSGLRHLNVSGNPFVRVLDSTFSAFIERCALTKVTSLVMRDTGLESITDRAFSPLTQLETLDIRNSFIDSYDREVFWGLRSLQQLYTDDSDLCCPYFHDLRTLRCVAPVDELSSCEDLLRMDIFRAFLWLIALLAVTGNAGAILYRLLTTKQRALSTFLVLVINLCVADLLMGVYMMVIGIADAHFKGLYVAKKNVWKRSVVCKVVGFLGFVSSEASAMTVCLITLDRVLVLCFPLKSHFHLATRSSLAACGVLWFVAVTLAAVPLLAGLEFYGVSSICLPLPITRSKFSGQFYSFGVFIVFNFVVFIFIGLGQVFIYRAILSTSQAAHTNKRPQEMTIARRLLLIILSDFCCWFPIGLMGLMVVGGVPIPDEVNVWCAIFVLPSNSALNPLLYTLNSFLEKRRAKQLTEETRKVLSSIQTEHPELPAETANEVARICIQSNLVNRDKVLNMLQDSALDDPESAFTTDSVTSGVVKPT